MEIIGWLLVGLLAGGIASYIVPGRTPGGTIGAVIVGILGGMLGGWLINDVLDWGTGSSFIGSLVVAVVGAVIILFGYNKMSSN